MSLTKRVLNIIFDNRRLKELRDVGVLTGKHMKALNHNNKATTDVTDQNQFL